MTKQAFITAIFNNENVFTAATNRYINANYPELRHFYFHVPNESATNDLMRIKLMGMGVLPGVPDFIFIWPKLWFLELKQPKGIISPKQKDLHQRWAQKGLIVHIARNGQEVCNVLDKMF
jgi:hypothetical protein